MNPTSTNLTFKSERTPMSSLRKTSLTAGALYLLTFVSIPTLALYGAIHDPSYITGPGPDSAVIVGGIQEIIVALAGIATAVALYPVLKKQSEGLALGLVASRIVEAGTMFAGVAFLHAVVALRQEGANADAIITGHALSTLYDRIFLLGQGFMPAMNDLLLGLLLYHSRLVPRSLSLIGIIGAPVLIAGYLAVLFGFLEQHAATTALFAIPVAVFEFTLGLWLLIKGFNPGSEIMRRG